MTLRVCLAYCLACGFFLSRTAFAAVLYTGAPTYPIAEQPMTDLIKTRIENLVQSGQWQKLMTDAIEKMKKEMLSPAVSAWTTPTKTPRTFYYNPTVYVPTAITTPSGTIIVPASTAYNPLTTVRLDETLVFFDASDKAQLAWAKKEAKVLKGQVKWILVGGNWLAESKALHTQVYVDQGGHIVKQLGIMHVPAIVSQAGLRLKIEEVRP